MLHVSTGHSSPRGFHGTAPVETSLQLGGLRGRQTLGIIGTRTKPWGSHTAPMPRKGVFVSPHFLVAISVESC